MVQDKTEKPTIQAVADLAGVSRSTATDTFARPERVNAATQRAVRDAAKELGYVRRRYTKRSHAPVYCYLWPRSEEGPEWLTEHWAQDSQAVAQAAARHNAVGMSVTPNADGVRAEVAVLERVWTSGAVAGFVLTDAVSGDDPRHAWLISNDVPFVQHGRGQSNSDYSWVDLDGQAAVTELTQLAIHHGHTAIAHLGFTPDGTGPPAQRRAGYTFAMETAGLDPKTEVVDHGLIGTQRAKFDGHLDALLGPSELPRPTAIICASDTFALGVQRYLLTHGLPIDDVAVTGVDDSLARRYSPKPFPTAGVGWTLYGDVTITFLEHAIKHPGRHLHSLQAHAMVDLDRMAPPRR